jgi:recombination protein RecT
MANNNQIANRTGGAPVAPPTFSSFMLSNAVKKKVNEMVGGDAGPRFISSIVSAVSVNPALAACDHGTILSAALLGESLKLSPSPQLGQYYMVPFNDRKNGRTVATFQLGYKGYIQLAIRSGQYKKLNVLAIKDGELIRFDPLNEEIEVSLIQDEVQREAAKTIGYYAMFEYTNGFRKAMYWSVEKMMAHADKYSKAFSAKKYIDLLDGKIPESEMWKYSSFWYKDFDGMAYKTMLRQLISKWGIMSIDMQKAYTGDMAVTYGDGSVEYVDNAPGFTQDGNPVAAYTVDESTGEVIDADPNTAAPGPAPGPAQVSMNDL